MLEKTPSILNAESKATTCEKSETLPENKPLKRTVILIYLGFVFLTVLFVGLVAKNVPQQPTWVDNPKELMENDIRSERLLERLEESDWQEEKEINTMTNPPENGTENQNSMESEIPNEENQSSLQDNVADYKTLASDLRATERTLNLDLTLNTQAAQSPISVYHGDPSALKSKKVLETQNDSHELSTELDSHSFMEKMLNTQTQKDNDLQQNGQTHKKDFLNETMSNSDNSTFPSTLQKPLSPYTITAGTALPATLVTGINSDLPGTVIAKISQSVYDAATGNYLLIPQGSTLIGKYDAEISFGQSRLLLVWSRLIFPNGSSINLNNMPGVDLRGFSGLKDKVNYHTARLFSNALLYSTFSAASQVNHSHHDRDSYSAPETMANTLAEQMSQMGRQTFEKHLQVQPTLEIRPGTRFMVMLTKDLNIIEAKK